MYHNRMPLLYIFNNRENEILFLFHLKANIILFKVVSISILASKERVCRLEQNLEDLAAKLDTSKAREDILLKDLTGLYITKVV